MKIAIAGAGFTGSVLAHELAKTGLHEISVFETRDHIGGNCYTFRDPETNILVHKYGPHIFNTNFEHVWTYVNKFSRFRPYTNRVKAVSQGSVYSLPINLHTINQFFGKTFSPDEAKAFIQTQSDKSIEDPQTFEEQALRFLGPDLYKAFFYGYTKKQWGLEPKELPAAILKRLPVRFNYDDNYFNSRWQGMPENGYTPIFERLLDGPSISVRLNSEFDSSDANAFDFVFFTGPLDAFYKHKFGRLRYRSLSFEPIRQQGDFQGNAVVNYCDESVPFTRISEHKHFAPWEEHEQTLCFKEYSKEASEADEPYYPVRLSHDKDLLSRYAVLAQKEEKVSFTGRLGSYRYMNMDLCIKEALDLATKFIKGGPESCKNSLM